MKLSRATKYGIAGLGVVLLLCLGLTIFATSGSTKSTAIVDPTVCEYCGKKLNKSGECSKCMAEMGAEKYRAKRESKNWYNSPAIATSIISILCVLIAVHIGLTLWKLSKRKKAEVFFHVHCKKCGRKLRYRESQINRLGKCPLCQKALHFPQPLVEPKPSVWKKLTWRKIREIVWD